MPASVTVVIPTYERAEMLQLSLASALGQTRDDLEVVVSDNASTDGTVEVLAAVTDPRVRVLRQPVNLGMAGNYNAGLAEVRTPFVALLLDDDLWEPRFLERTLPVLEAQPQVGLVHTAFAVIDGDGVVVDDYRDWHRDGPAPTRTRSGAGLLRDLLLGDNPVMVSSSVMRTSALPARGYDAVDVQAEDVGVLLPMALDWDVAFVAEPLARFRQHEQSASTGASHVLGAVTVPGYLQVSQWRAVKDRFLDQHAERAHRRDGSGEDLRRGVAAKARRDALDTVAALTATRRDPRSVVREVRAASTHVPGLWRDRDTWSLLAVTALGRARVDRALTRARRAKEPSRSPTAR